MPASPYPARTEIVFVFDNLPDWQQLADGVQPGAQVVVLDGTQDGLAQVAAHLQGREGVDAIHILSHGQPASLQLGSLTLDQAALAARADTLAQIGSALSDSGDILLYGCDVADGDAGLSFVNSLAQVTGADVAASNDVTGNARRGGNWVLELQTGRIETKDALTRLAQAAYTGTLAVTDESFDALGLITENGTSMTAGSWRFATNADADMAVADADEYGVWLNNDGGAGDRAVLLNYNAALGVTDFRMLSADLSKFKLKSLKIGQQAGANHSLMISGWSNGALVATGEAVDLTSSDASGNVTYSLIGNDSNGPYGVLTFNAQYSYIDEIRFVFSGGSVTDLHIDDIDVSAAVPPAALTSATYDASTGILSVTGTNITNGGIIDVSKLRIYP